MGRKKALPADLGLDDGLLFDCAYQFSIGRSFDEIAEHLRQNQMADRIRAASRDAKTFPSVKKVTGAPLSIHRKRIPSILKECFDRGILNLPVRAPLILQNDFSKYCGDVKSEVISARNMFAQYAARRVLYWIKDHFGDDFKDRPCIAIGGGSTLLRVVEAMEEVLRENQDLSAWYANFGMKIACVPATTGGTALSPDFDAVYCSIRFGKTIGSDVGSISVSRRNDTTAMEEAVVKHALRYTRLVITGVGDPDSFCLRTMRDLKVLPEEHAARAVGEFLYHPVDENCEPILKSRSEMEKLVVKEDELDIPQGKGKEESGKSPGVLATLFRLSSLGSAERPVMAIVSGDPNRVRAKAKAVKALLDHDILSYLCVSGEIAQEILGLSRGAGASRRPEV